MNRSLPLFLLAAASVTQLSCERQADAPKEWEVELQRGYAEKRHGELIAFLDAWQKHSSPASTDLVTKKPKFEQAVYHLYQGFFRPEESYEHTQYVVIQDKVNLYIVDTDFRGLEDAKPVTLEESVQSLPVISHLEVRQFRPAVSLPKKKVLYLQDAYLAPVLGFLTQNNGHAMLDRYADEECESEERIGRLEYLNSHLKIIPGHWGTGWHFDTHPHVDAVYLGADLKQALVLFREGYGGGAAIMKETANGQWKVIAKAGTWVE